MRMSKLLQKFMPSNEKVHLMSDRDIMLHMLVPCPLAFASFNFALSLRNAIPSGIAGLVSNDLAGAATLLGVTLLGYRIWLHFRNRSSQEAKNDPS